MTRVFCLMQIGMLAGALIGGISLAGCRRNGSSCDSVRSAPLARQEHMRALLKRQIAFHADGEHVRSVLERLARASSVNIVLSQELLSSVSCDRGDSRSPFQLTPRQRKFLSVTLHARNEAVADILDALCAQLDLRWVYPDPQAPPEKRFGFVYLYPTWTERED